MLNAFMLSQTWGGDRRLSELFSDLNGLILVQTLVYKLLCLLGGIFVDKMVFHETLYIFTFDML